MLTPFKHSGGAAIRCAFILSICILPFFYKTPFHTQRCTQEGFCSAGAQRSAGSQVRFSSAAFTQGNGKSVLQAALTLPVRGGFM